MDAETLEQIEAAEKAIEAWKAQYPKGPRSKWMQPDSIEARGTYPGNAVRILPYRETVNGPVSIAIYVRDVAHDTFKQHSGYNGNSDALPPAVFGLPEEMDGIPTLVFARPRAVRSGKWTEIFERRIPSDEEFNDTEIAHKGIKQSRGVISFVNVSALVGTCRPRTWDEDRREWVYGTGPCIRMTMPHPGVLLGRDGPPPEFIDVDDNGTIVRVPVCPEMGTIWPYDYQ